MHELEPQAKGRRTLLATFERHAHDNPTRTFAAVARSGNIQDGFDDVSFAQVSRAVDCLAYDIEREFGRSKTFETILFFDSGFDLRYALAFFAFQKCGFKVLLLGASNSAENNVRLMRETNCLKCAYTSHMQPKVAAFQAEIPGLKKFEMQPWTYYLQHYEKPFPFTKSFEDTKWDPVVVMHSSGSTGTPRPVTLVNGYFSTNDVVLPPVAGRQIGGLEAYDRLDDDGRMYCPIPMSHLSGFIHLCHYPIYADCINVVAPPPSDPKVVKDVIDAQNVKLLYVAPSHVEAISRLPDGIQSLSRLNYLCYVGGPLAPAVGDALKDSVNLLQYYGSTETGGAPLLLPKRDDWQYLEFHPSAIPVMDPYIDGASELVWKRTADNEKYLMSVYGVPDELEIRTKDLFMPHATKPGLWRFYGRKDDVLVLGSGLKFNPVPAEIEIMGHATVSGALIVGQGRDRTALLVEAASGLTSTDHLIDEIWPTIEQANSKLLEGGTISKDMISVVQPASFVRAAKGTIVRRLTTQKFEVVIDGLYK